MFSLAWHSPPVLLLARARLKQLKPRGQALPEKALAPQLLAMVLQNQHFGFTERAARDASPSKSTGENQQMIAGEVSQSIAHGRMPAQYSATGTRTRVARVRAEYPSQLDYGGC